MTARMAATSGRCSSPRGRLRAGRGPDEDDLPLRAMARPTHVDNHRLAAERRAGRRLGAHRDRTLDGGYGLYLPCSMNGGSSGGPWLRFYNGQWVIAGINNLCGPAGADTCSPYST